MNDESPVEFQEGRLIEFELLRASLRRCGRNVRVFRGCRIIHPERVDVGSFSQIDEGVRIFPGSGVRIGRHVHLAFGCSISGGGECDIGDFAGIGAEVRIITGTEVIDAGGLTNPTIPDELRTVRRGRVVVGAHAVVFTGSIVLPNVVIGEGAVVAAGSVVHHDLRPWGIYAGNPLVQVGLRDSDEVLRKAHAVLQRDRLH